MIRVRDLKAALAALPDDMPVVVRCPRRNRDGVPDPVYRPATAAAPSASIFVNLTPVCVGADPIEIVVDDPFVIETT